MQMTRAMGDYVSPPEARCTAVGGASFADIWSRPMPGMDETPGTRLICKALLMAFRQRLPEVSGAEFIQPGRDPFILTLNHSTRLEAVLVPSVLAFLRQGRQVRFFTDWNFQLWPVVGQIIRLGEPITVTRKPARPRALNFFRPLFVGRWTPMEQGRRCLADGESVGIYPEGTVNKNARELMQGDRGAVWLSLTTGAPVVPAGIRYTEGRRMELNFGAPLRPRAPARSEVGLAEAKAWHARIMNEISRLCGKTWNHQLVRKKHEHH